MAPDGGSAIDFRCLAMGIKDDGPAIELGEVIDMSMEEFMSLSSPPEVASHDAKNAFGFVVMQVMRFILCRLCDRSMGSRSRVGSGFLEADGLWGNPVRRLDRSLEDIFLGRNGINQSYRIADDLRELSWPRLMIVRRDEDGQMIISDIGAVVLETSYAQLRSPRAWQQVFRFDTSECLAEQIWKSVSLKDEINDVLGSHPKLGDLSASIQQAEFASLLIEWLTVGQLESTGFLLPPAFTKVWAEVIAYKREVDAGRGARVHTPRFWTQVAFNLYRLSLR